MKNKIKNIVMDSTSLFRDIEYAFKNDKPSSFNRITDQLKIEVDNIWFDSSFNLYMNLSAKYIDNKDTLFIESCIDSIYNKDDYKYTKESADSLKAIISYSCNHTGDILEFDIRAVCDIFYEYNGINKMGSPISIDKVIKDHTTNKDIEGFIRWYVSALVRKIILGDE